MKKVISSQSFIDYDIVDKKIAQLSGKTSITVDVWTTGLTNDDGDELVVLFDKHHTVEAAQEMGIEIAYNETAHPEGLTGIDLIEASRIDSDWHYIDTNENVW